MLEARERPVILRHNLDPNKFVWLWMKYVRGVNLKHHCTNCLRGPYGKKLSKHNSELVSTPKLVLDEQTPGSYGSLYICGVAQEGYRRNENYPHNLHAAILPAPGLSDSFQFENWKLLIENGRFLQIPSEGALSEELH